MTDCYKSSASTHTDDCWSWGQGHYECAVREIKALRADLLESDEIREKLGHLLTRTAAALKGEPPEGVWHSWHDLPEKATQLVGALRKLEERARRAAYRCATQATRRAEMTDRYQKIRDALVNEATKGGV